jgi:hypothetical protein
LFDLSVKLLNLPTDSALFSSGICGFDGCIVSNDVFRLVVRDNDPEQLHQPVDWQVFEFAMIAKFLGPIPPRQT